MIKLLKEKDCQICKKEVKEGEGISIKTDKIKGKTRMHNECFDEMWADYMELDKDNGQNKPDKVKEEPYTTCDNCETKINIKEAIKEYCGCGCNNYFCDENCQQEFRDKN